MSTPNQNETGQRVVRAMQLLDTMCDRAARKGMRLPVPHPDSIELFMQLPEARQRRFVESLEQYAPIFETQLSHFEIDRSTSVEQERKCLQSTERNLGLKIHRSVYDQLAEGDVVEIYDVESIQIYRNINFFRTTNYSLIDVISNPWMRLWERPRRITEAIANRVQEVVSAPGERLVPFDVAPHLLGEQAFGKSQVFSVTMKSIAKIIDHRDQLYGVLSIIRVDMVADGAEAGKLGFL